MFQVELGAEGMEDTPGVNQMAVAGVLKALNGAACLEEVAALDSLVTVVDCSAFACNLTTTADLLEQFGKNQAGEGEVVEDEMAELSVASLLIQQIEFANIIVLNKCDLVSADTAANVEAALRALNAKADVIKTTRARVPVELVLRTGKFDMDDTLNAAGWVTKIRGNELTNSKQYGISSFVYQERTPFHPVRLHTFFEDNFMCDYHDNGDDDDGGTESAAAETGEAPDDVHTMRTPLEVRQEECDAKMAAQRAKYGTILRSKGYVWLAGRDEVMGEVGQAGAVMQLSCGRPWMGLMPEELWPQEGSDERDLIERDMAGPVLLDRRQELVFIGQNLDKSAITAALNGCLVTRAEAARGREAAGGGGGESLRKDEWKLGLNAIVGQDEDPFPTWYGIDAYRTDFPGCKRRRFAFV